MSVYLKLILGLVAVSMPFIANTIYITRKEVKHNRQKGCTCLHPYIGLVELDCPVHYPLYVRNYQTIDGRISTDVIPASGGEREPICDKCLEKILPRGYILSWPFEPEEGWCHSCGRMEQIRMMPDKDIFNWKSIDNLK